MNLTKEQTQIKKQGQFNGEKTFYNSKEIIDQNVKCETTKLLQDNVGKNFGYFVFGDAVFNTTP